MIETERLFLRLPVADDAGAVAEALADPAVMRFIGDGETGTISDAVAQVESMRRAWREDGFGRFIVERAADGAVIGYVGLLAWDARVWRPALRSEIGAPLEVELGWILLSEAWGNGYATEAATAVREWARRERQLGDLISLIHPANARSIAVATKLGARLEREVTTYRGVVAQLWRS